MARGFNLTAQLNLRGPTNVRAVVADIQRQLNGITANVNINLNANTARNIGQINQQLTTLNNTLRNTQNFANNATQAINNLGNAIRNLNTAANNLPRNMNAINNATRNVNQNLNNVRNQTRATTSEFEEFGRQSALALRRFAAFAPVAGIFYKLSNAIGSSTREFINFDRELVRIAQVTDTSVKNLKTLESQITTLATQYGVASSALIQVSTTLAQAGLSAKDTERALKALAMSAMAPSFDDLNETVEGSIALMRQFGISASDLESALGSVNAVAAKFAVEASDLITAIQRTGGVFATASRGVSEGKDALNEFLAVFTSVRATTRESAETIATGLRTIFTRIQRSETIEQLQKFGVVLTDLTGKFVGPYEAIRRLSEGLSKLDPRDLRFSEIVEELGGFRQIGKVIPLIQQFATAQQALKVAQQGQGSLAQDAATAQQALAVKMSKVTEEFNALIRSIGQSQGFKDMIGMALDLASALIRIADSAKSVLPALTAIMAIRGFSAAAQFATGFSRGIRRQSNGGPVRGFARGGMVPGVGNGDTVPAMLEPGEFVIRKRAVATIGANNLHKINSGRKKFAVGGGVHFSHLDAGPNVIDLKSKNQRYLGKGLSGVGIMLPDIWNLGFAQKNWEGIAGAQLKNYIANQSVEDLFARQIGRKRFGRKHSGKTGSFRGGAKNPVYDNFIANLESIKKNIVASIQSNKIYKNNEDLYPIGQAMLKASGIAAQELTRIRTIQNPQGGYEDIGNKDQRQLYFQHSTKRDPEKMFRRFAYKKSLGGIIQKFARGGKGKALGARSRFKELDESELAQLSTSDLIKYAKRQARDVFSTGGAGMAIGSRFIETPASKITPELAPHLTSYMGKQGFWKEEIAPFGKSPKPKASKQSKLGREEALKRQVSRQADEVAARAQQWQSIRSGSKIDSYLLSSLKEPILADYKTAKMGQPLAKAFHETRLRKAVNESLDAYDDFDYSPAKIDKLVSSMAQKRFAVGGSVEDKVPALLTPGEFVINKKAASRIGSAKLHRLNQADRIQGFNKGGSVGYIQRLENGGPADGRFAELVKRFKAAGDDIATAARKAREQIQSDLSQAPQRIPSSATAQQDRLLRRAQERGVDTTTITAANPNRRQSAAGFGVSNIRSAVAAQNIISANIQQQSMMQGPAPTAAQRANANSYQANLANRQSGFRSSNLSQAGQQFATQIAGVKTPLQQFGQNLVQLGRSFSTVQGATAMLGQAAKNAGSGLLGMARSAGGRVLGGIGSAISTVGGGALSMMGLPGSSQPGARFAAGRRAVAARRAGGGGAGGGFGMAGMALTMGGGLAVDAISQNLGGEKTKAGRETAAIGGSILNMGATGAAIGSMFGPMGTVVGAATGALVGYVQGLEEANKANEEYAQSQRQATAEKKAEKSGAALNKMMTAETKGNRILAEREFLASFQETSESESAVGAGIKSQQPGFFGRMLGYKGETSIETGERRAETQKAGAQQAEQYLAAQMMDTGKTFDELKSSMKPETFEMLTRNIAESDKTYATYQVGMRKQIDAATDPAEKARLEAELNTQTKIMAESISRRQLAEEQSAAMAKKAADASKRLAEVAIQVAQTMIKNVLNKFEKMGSVIDAAANRINDASENFDNILNNQASAVSQSMKNDIRALKDPNANVRDRDEARKRAASGLGATGQEALQMAKLGDNIKEIGLKAANTAVGKGGTTAEQNTNMASAVKEQLKAEIIATYGPDSDMARSLINGVNHSVNEMVKAAEKSGETLDADKLVDAAAGNLIDASEKAGQLLIKQAELIAEGYQKISDAASKLVAAKEQERDKTSKVTKELRLNAQALEMSRIMDPRKKENRALMDAIRNPLLNIADDLRILPGRNEGDRAAAVANPAAANQRVKDAAKAVAAADAAVKQKDKELADARAKPVPANPKLAEQQQQQIAALEAARGQAVLAQTQARANLDRAKKAVTDTVDALFEMSKTIQEAIDKRQEQVIKDAEDRLRAGEAFAESLVTKTPEEMMDLNATFATLNNTLNGNIIGFNQSLDAQRAYMSALQQGKTVQEAYADAQSAFANRNKQALSLFSELTQMAGVKGFNLDLMKADLLENFAMAQGQGLQNQPLFQQIIAELRKSPEQRAQEAVANDPVAQVLRAGQNEINQNLNAMIALDERIGAANIEALQAGFDAVVNAVAGGAAGAGGKSRGGIVYASKGKYVNFEPKGTDTIPAMLTPGEFVINRASTQKYLPLLQQINNDSVQTAEHKALSRGGVVYLQAGGQPNFLQNGEQQLNDANKKADRQDTNRMGNIMSGGARDNGLSPQVRAYYGNGPYEIEAMDRGVHVNQVYNDRRIWEHMQRYAQRWIYFRNRTMKAIMERRRQSFTAKKKQAGGNVDPDIEVEYVDRIGEMDAAYEAHKKLEALMFPNPRLREIALRNAPELSPLQIWENQTGGNVHVRPEGRRGRGMFDMMAMASGGVVYAAKGRLMPYAPRGTDSVPAMLTPGEFVINRQSAQKHMSLLNQINNDTLSRGGAVYANKGGLLYARDGVKVDNQSGANVSQQDNMITIKIISDPNDRNNNQSSENKGVLNTDGLKIFVDKFDSFVASLSALQIPTKFEHTHTLDVNFTGADVLGELVREDGKLAQWVIGKIDEKFGELKRNTEGAI